VANEAETKKPDPPADCQGPEDAARRERAVDDSIEATVAALKRIHCATELTKGLGDGGEPSGERSLVYDIVDINARYLRQLLGVAARANDQLAGLFDHAYATPGALKEKSIELTLERFDGKARGYFRLQNATSCAVNVDFPTRMTLAPRGLGEPVEVDLVFAVRVPKGDPPWETLYTSAVPPNGALEVRLTLSLAGSVAQRAWRGDTVIATDAAHDLGLVVELPASHEP
jgi:hypothetical protein